MKERYGTRTRFQSRSLELIAICDKIVTEYVAKGFRLTVRQIYYQLVAKGCVENSVRSYNSVQGMLNDARLSGLIDWDAIEDRTRGITERGCWTSGSQLLARCAEGYHENMWREQSYLPIVIVEKEALAGVLEPVCTEYDVPLLPARGYPSSSTLRELAKERIMPSRHEIVVLHLGDHDPSGIDMSRDLAERLALFSREETPIDFRRIALNMAQVEEHQPPPNPAKSTDARFKSYEREFGDESWELDALTPELLAGLVEGQLNELIDWDVWNATQARIATVRDRLAKLAHHFEIDGEPT